MVTDAGSLAGEPQRRTEGISLKTITKSGDTIAATRTERGIPFRWWFFPLLALMFFFPPVAQRGFTPDTWSAIIRTTLGGAWIHALRPAQPALHVCFLLLLLLVFVRPGRFMRLFNAYAAISFFVFAVVQNVTWSEQFGYSIVTSNFVWFVSVGLAWISEVRAPANRERRLRFHPWHLWAIPLCVVAFWAPDEAWSFHPKYLLWSMAPLAFCLMTPIYLTVHASYYPLANAALLRVTGGVGVLVALVNFLTAYGRGNLYSGAMHVPLMAVSCLALVLAGRQSRSRRGSSPPAANPHLETGSTCRPDVSVSVRGLVKRYNGRAAVDGVSFDVAPGELFGLLGPNGAGKTTTVECIAGLREPSGGRIRVEGLDPVLDARAMRRCLGIQLQKSALPDALTVIEAVHGFARFYGTPVEPASLMQRLDLASCRNTLYGRLSGGQKQRVHFLLALLGDPQVLIADEPTTGLDPIAREAVWELLRERKREGKSSILTTHFMHEAQALCDRLAFIREGRIIAEGTPSGLIGELGWKTKIALRLDKPCDANILRALPAVFRISQEDSQLHVYATGDMVLNEVLASISQQACVVQDVKTYEASLDDVFVTLASAASAEKREEP